jgi:Tol biopolymer transport system component
MRGWRLTTIALGLGAALAGCADSPVRPKSNPTRIVFASARVLNTEIWVMNADGSDQKQLTFTSNSSGAPSWSPDGSRILFTRWWLVGSDLRSGLFRMKSDGSEVTCLDSIPDAYYGSPHDSPDGTRIVCERSGPSGSREVWLLNADGSSPMNLTPGGERGASPEWSPDGTRILYSRETAIGWRIYTMKPDGTDTLKVLETGVANSNQYQPSWSPDGASIVYVDDHGVHTATDFSWIDIVNADGSNARPLTPLTNGIRSEPCWSRDGLRIAYRDDIFPADIFSMDPDGSDVINVSRYPGAHDISPDWGPAAP